MNIASQLRTWAEVRPDAPALIYPARVRKGRPRGDAQCSFQQLDQDSDHLAAALARAGIHRGMRTVLMVPPGRDFVGLAFGLLKLGAVLVLVDPGVGPRRLGRCLAEAEPEAFVGVPRAQLARIVLRWARTTLRIRVTVGGSRWIPGTPLSALLRATSSAPPAQRPIAETAPNDTAGVFFTSGSTGSPKGVVYTHGVFAAQLQFLRSQLGLASEEIDLATFPPFALFDPALGVTAVIPDMDASRPARADPAVFVDTIVRHGVTQMFASPAVLDRIGRFGSERPLRLPSLRRVVSAGAPVRIDVLERMQDLLEPEAEIFTPYGATEALPVTWIGAREILDETRHETARGGGTCVGRTIEGLSLHIIRITDEAIPVWSDDDLLPEGTVGEIAVAGPVVTHAYFGQPDATGRAKIPSVDGTRFFHRMGDCGRLDGAGRLWFYGRKSHRVRTAEGDLWPVSCEGVANQHPDIFQSALVGIGAVGSQRPVLCLSLETGRTGGPRVVDEVLALCGQYPGTKAIQTALFYRRAFPVDRRHNSKIDRPALAAWTARRLG